MILLKYAFFTVTLVVTFTLSYDGYATYSANQLQLANMSVQLQESPHFQRLAQSVAPPRSQQQASQ